MFNTDLKGEKNQLDFAQTLRNQLNQQLGDSQVRIVDKYTFV